MHTGTEYRIDARLTDGQRGYLPDPVRYSYEAAIRLAEAVFQNNDDVATVTVTRSVSVFTKPCGNVNMNPTVVYSKSR